MALCPSECAKHTSRSYISRMESTFSVRRRHVTHRVTPIGVGGIAGGLGPSSREGRACMHLPRTILCVLVDRINVVSHTRMQPPSRGHSAPHTAGGMSHAPPHTPAGHYQQPPGSAPGGFAHLGGAGTDRTRSPGQIIEISRRRDLGRTVDSDLGDVCTAVVTKSERREAIRIRLYTDRFR